MSPTKENKNKNERKDGKKDERQPIDQHWLGADADCKHACDGHRAASWLATRNER